MKLAQTCGIRTKIVLFTCQFYQLDIKVAGAAIKKFCTKGLIHN